jgi:hypothetical protein
MSPLLALKTLIPELDSAPAIQFGVPEIDSALPSNGLRRGAIHEIFYHDPLIPNCVARTIPSILAYNARQSLLESLKDLNWGAANLTLKEKLTSLSLPRIVWIGRSCWPAPPALAALGVRSAENNTRDNESEELNTNTLVDSLFQGSLFIDPPDETTTLWAIDLALRSPGVDLVVAATPKISRITTQRFSLAAGRYSTTALLLRDYQDCNSPSSAHSKWVISPCRSDNDTPSWSVCLAKLKGGALTQGSEWVVRLQDETKGAYEICT